MWSSAFLQSSYYFKDLPLSPLRQLKRLLLRTRAKASDPPAERRILEQYRSAWGEKVTRESGRGVGWLESISLIEKFTYPLILLYLAIFHHEVFFITVAAETLVCMFLILTTADPGSRLKYAAMMVPAIPIRLMSLGVDLFAALRCLADIATGNREWRK